MTSPTTPDRPAQIVPDDVVVPFSGISVGAPHRSAPMVPDDRRARLVFSLVAGVLLLLCMGGVGVFVSLYDNATKIERTAPDAVVDQYLRAYLVNRDDKQAALFRCQGAGDPAPLVAYRSEIESQEAKHSISIRVTWSSLVVTPREGARTVATDLRRAISDGSESVIDRWQFDVVDKDGWRVCGATKIS